MTDTSKLIVANIKKKIAVLKNNSHDGTVKADMANLRKGVGKKPGELPQIWGLIYEDLPEELFGKGEKASKEEWAIYIPLTMFALHQQGSDIKTNCMHEEGKYLGYAVGDLVRDKQSLKRIKNRFDALVTSQSVKELSNHLRGIIQLMKAEGVHLDYGSLANDIYWFQIPSKKNNVTLQWARQFYLTTNKKEREEEENGK
ncbi:type I-E CRISPR-associated protein Cse2/CasB [Gudongella oleilytica]|jgi:CRISPR system Cascade subunit CasB|uniref:type I-E CRISPR-associated protein Cse2/CasB n=1 Tax=Gudongella oleilytica TaxID=1582259 RepID=UPI000FF8B6F2|nr:type I-E CRISPR-associated protein Cse2/CasB [Gudongella oleilytica]